MREHQRRQPYTAMSCLVDADTQAWIVLDGDLTVKSIVNIRKMLVILDSVVVFDDELTDAGRAAASTGEEPTWS